MNSEGVTNKPSKRKKSKSVFFLRIGTQVYKKLRKCSADSKRESSQDRSARKTANATIAIALSTLLSIGVSYFILKGQLDEMQNEQRPWISASITGLASPLKIEDGKLSLHVKYHIKNVGKLPATRVFPYIALVPFPQGEAPEIRDAVKQACNHIIDMMNDDINNAGTTLFPEDFADSSFGVDQPEITDFEFTLHGKTPPILVPFCLVYQIPDGSSAFHYTPAVYVLTNADLTPIDITHIPAEGIVPVIHPMAQGNLPPT